MTPFVPAPGLVQAELIFGLELVNIENRLWFLKEDLAITQSDLDSLAVGVSSWYVGHVLPYLSSSLQLKGVLTRKFDDHDGDLFGEVTGRDIGGEIGYAYSANVAVRVNLRWPIQHRERKNCNFVPGIPDSALNGNVVDLTWANIVWEGYVFLIDYIRFVEPANGWKWVLASAYDDGALRSEQFIAPCIGPTRWTEWRIAQRRKRLA